MQKAGMPTAATASSIFTIAKPAGKPGKLSFTMVDGPASEIKDLQLDSGSVQLRGHATLSNEGSLDKAELSTFKLSPGDDMRAEIERSSGVYKVTIRGNVGDARPFVKGSVSAVPTGRNGAAQKDGRDVDLDLSLNILTGFNDEAITNASIKASMRKDSGCSTSSSPRLSSVPEKMFGFALRPCDRSVPLFTSVIERARSGFSSAARAAA